MTEKKTKTDTSEVPNEAVKHEAAVRTPVMLLIQDTGGNANFVTPENIAGVSKMGNEGKNCYVFLNDGRKLDVKGSEHAFVQALGINVINVSAAVAQITGTSVSSPSPQTPQPGGQGLGKPVSSFQSFT
jgi:hypothetical protein